MNCQRTALTVSAILTLALQAAPPAWAQAPFQLTTTDGQQMKARKGEPVNPIEARKGEPVNPIE